MGVQPAASPLYYAARGHIYKLFRYYKNNTTM